MKEKLSKKASITPTVKPQTGRTTRGQVAVKQMSVIKQRAYWAEKQRARRATMTPEDMERVKARVRQCYAEMRGKVKFTVEKQTTLHASPATTELNSSLNCFSGSPNNLHPAVMCINEDNNAAASVSPFPGSNSITDELNCAFLNISNIESDD
ncbi:hypothetical protein RRG08_035470 [Elysia crispata]|uniref:Uncharacterized protein n=1 Tax=Elysia crispata TaxID=231223 RepID=A0AAE1AQP8_9GAST|nr:hypothetical protein RRG08_035470 [Elysia crispata]